MRDHVKESLPTGWPIPCFNAKLFHANLEGTALSLRQPDPPHYVRIAWVGANAIKGRIDDDPIELIVSRLPGILQHCECLIRPSQRTVDCRDMIGRDVVSL